ncbi:MAG TPA: hypothetical protein PLI59_15290 [Candidatus Obscuribacter sp.]|nr:hypothetical protein [Candidatus Obscuribacter sp.]HMW89116.1 hypothetical protein [Candidatus Obscuribacter sp.]HMY03876.1 hypothetical protein [Candidatus Obscuribacter sp.]HNA71983.1 hypothetical protein [Candidatus Obscuribacter sp.]HNG20546.1 hypothetical protein [Candidatus Obscuribacter sp.]
MTVTQDELMYLQSQLEGLESIFMELMPFGIELKRQHVQDYYDKRFDAATKPVSSVAENELRRQFNTKANQVRNLVDSAESLGDAGNRLNLIRAAASLPEERSKGLLNSVLNFSKAVVMENRVETELFNEILQSKELRPVEARVLLGAAMFVIDRELPTQEGINMPVIDILGELVQMVRREQLLTRNDPFLVEAQCALEALEMEEEELQS